MIYSIIDANLEHQEEDGRISELIYQIESQNIDVEFFSLRQLIEPTSCNEVLDLIEASQLAIYICPVDAILSRRRLKRFLNHYDKQIHPPIYLILDATRLLSVEEVQAYIDEFESFAQQNHSRIVNVKYFKDALEAL